MFDIIIKDLEASLGYAKQTLQKNFYVHVLFLFLLHTDTFVVFELEYNIIL